MHVRYSVVVLALIGAPALTHAQSIFTVVPTPNGHHGTTNNALQAVSASSPSDIWAVGQTTIHFDGTGWTAFPAPMINGDNTSYLDGVVDISPTEAWAGGIVGIGTATPGQVIERWDGTAWRVFPGPTFSSGDQPEIYGMTGVSATDIWAVGALLANNQTLYALFEHWDGTAWTAKTGPFHGFFRSVSADAPNDVWAVGYSTASQKPPPGQYDVPTKTLILHYDGTGWSVVSSPNVGPNSQYQSNRLLGATAVSSTDIWAFGSYFAASGSENQITLLLHWDGTRWSLAPCPSPKPGDFLDDILYSGVVTAPGSVWIVGSLAPAAQGKPVTATFVLHTTGG